MALLISFKLLEKDDTRLRWRKANRKNQRTSLAAYEETLTSCNWRTDQAEDLAFIRVVEHQRRPNSWSKQVCSVRSRAGLGRAGVGSWDLEWDIWTNTHKKLETVDAPRMSGSAEWPSPPSHLKLRWQHAHHLPSWPHDQQLRLDHNITPGREVLGLIRE